MINNTKRAWLAKHMTRNVNYEVVPGVVNGSSLHEKLRCAIYDDLVTKLPQYNWTKLLCVDDFNPAMTVDRWIGSEQPTKKIMPIFEKVLDAVFDQSNFLEVDSFLPKGSLVPYPFGIQDPINTKRLLFFWASKMKEQVSQVIEYSIRKQADGVKIVDNKLIAKDRTAYDLLLRKRIPMTRFIDTPYGRRLTKRIRSICPMDPSNKLARLYLDNYSKTINKKAARLKHQESVNRFTSYKHVITWDHISHDFYTNNDLSQAFLDRFSRATRFPRMIKHCHQIQWIGDKAYFIDGSLCTDYEQLYLEEPSHYQETGADSGRFCIAEQNFAIGEACEIIMRQTLGIKTDISAQGINNYWIGSNPNVDLDNMDFGDNHMAGTNDDGLAKAVLDVLQQWENLTGYKIEIHDRPNMGGEYILNAAKGGILMPIMERFVEGLLNPERGWRSKTYYWLGVKSKIERYARHPDFRIVLAIIDKWFYFFLRYRISERARTEGLDQQNKAEASTSWDGIIMSDPKKIFSGLLEWDDLSDSVKAALTFKISIKEKRDLLNLINRVR